MKKGLIGLGLILTLVVGYAALKSDEFVVKREILIQAQPEAIFPYLDSSQKADEWMPWKDEDPTAVMEYSGPEKGVGSISNWSSSGRMGVGSAEVVEVQPNLSVKVKITYTKPMQMSQISDFILTKMDQGTQMTWTVSGKKSFFARLMCLLTFMDAEKYVGSMFEKGLNKLKSKVEAQQ